MSKLRFYQALLMLRAHAHMINDRAKASGMSKEDAHKAIEPLRHALDTMIAQGPSKDFDGMVTAAREFELEHNRYEESIKDMRERQGNIRTYITKMRHSFAAHLKLNAMTEMALGDSSVAIDEKGEVHIH